ncbi:MAG: carbamoyltransferase HypF [Verrucomicrobia bacterium]|nr:carbamoyltransferase HypF [Verrucomicrobiota bacterium]
MRASFPTVAAVVPTGPRLRLRLRLQGVVQGVGFRPHVYRLAVEAGLDGWVGNTPLGVAIEVEGGEKALWDFRRRLERERPPGSSIQSLEAVWLEAAGWTGFEIRPSDQAGAPSLLVRPDVAVCDACVREIFDPANRRFGYPFTNCTHCGPRYSILEALPYDRANTSMRRFEMCPECRREYQDPADRRFHAQPNACPKCGPLLELWSADGTPVARREEAMAEAVEALRRGRILAVKGLGGYQLLVDARSEAAVQALRQRKHREEKPLAVMVPGMEEARTLCRVSAIEEGLLRSPEAPIVLLRRLEGNLPLAAAVAPGHPFLGIMLPYTPLHHLLLAALRFPVVATSGNLSDEPICIDETEARERLQGIVDGFLVHNRPIVRQVDDSVVRVVAGREMVVRRARGYAPLPVAIAGGGSGSGPGETAGAGTKRGVLAVGGQLKNTVALSAGGAVVLSQHIGDLETAAALSAFRRVVHDLQRLFGVEPARVMADLHPDYVSTKEAKRWVESPTGVQHHHAHILSCMAENELEGPVLGIAWDGTGYGLDGMVWGGEFLIAEAGGYERLATLRPFRLPGGERAVREPRRSAAGLLFAGYGPGAFDQRDLPTLAAFSPAEMRAVRESLERPFNAPLTTAVGRLFDAVASLLGVRQQTGFEGQAAMALESLAMGSSDRGAYPLALRPAGGGTDPGEGGTRVAARDALWHADWGPLLDELLGDLRAGVPPERMAARFHRGLIELMVAVAARAGLERVAVSGGCFQNVVLLEGAIERLRAAGHRVYWHQRVPTNDGGLALGQAVAGMRSGLEGVT